MCGIAGCMNTRGPQDALQRIGLAMGDALRHRGPDDEGVWIDPAHGLALAHRRLAIIDLSAAAAQPMVSASDRYVLSYNGEIYNFQSLRKELAAYPFKGHSDTEVLLAAIEHWGLARALERIRGMFAFALWDRTERCLSLARDHAGKKPLYYGWFGQNFVFGSELKALRVHPAFDDTLDHDALAELLRFETISQPSSIYRQVRKLPPGNSLTVSASEPAWQVQPVAFWRACDVAIDAEQSRYEGSYEQALGELDQRVRQAVAARMVADVPLGALLSGGIDSSLVVAAMQAQSAAPVKTFTIGFNEPRFNEAEHAAAVARQLGTQHHELYLAPQQALDAVADLPAIYDEPFASSSQIPTLLVSRLARSEVTVALSGDGGDELFAGYNRYHRVLASWRRLQRVPFGLRRRIAALERSIEAASWNLLGPARPDAGTVAPWRRVFAAFGKNWGYWLAREPRELMAQRFAASWPVDALVPDARCTSGPFTNPELWAKVDDPLLALRHYDYIGFLGDSVLTKVDRASMAVSLEIRAPLLDLELLGFAWSLPADFVIADHTGKRILKDLLGRYLPSHLYERPKRGFSVPIAEWLRGPLRDWAGDLLNPDTLAAQGLLDVQRVQRAWHQHLCGWANHSEVLWSLLMFQAWCQSAGANTNSALPGS